MNCILVSAGESCIDVSSPTFLPDLSHSMRATFAFLWAEGCQRGARDADVLFREPGMGKRILKMLSCVHSAMEVPHEVTKTSPLGAFVGGRDLRLFNNSKSCAEARPGLLRIATWNIVGGRHSARAPKNYTSIDQRAGLVCDSAVPWCIWL